MIINVYALQHNLYNNLSFHYDQLNLLKLFSLLFIGFFTSFTPCLISILPLIFASIANIGNLNYLQKLFLLIGSITSLVIIIITLYLGNGKFDQIFVYLPFLSSLLFIFLALNLLNIINFNYFIDILYFNKSKVNNIYLESFILGFSIGFSSLPCNAPLILTTVLWLYDPNQILESLIYLFVYFFSCLFPFLAIFLLPFKLFKFQKIINLWDVCMELGGLYMLTLGSFMFFQYFL